jgi:hypothetical protein
LSLGHVIWPSGSLTSTVWPWWMEICGGPTWTLNDMASLPFALGTFLKPA